MRILQRPGSTTAPGPQLLNFLSQEQSEVAHVNEAWQSTVKRHFFPKCNQRSNLNVQLSPRFCAGNFPCDE
ncbi:unnamed protein product [Nesidiocoris tenuis]|uniref:Uncharacterized protein n=1 Tax=Nesidiocoris tenuis TaxID=355587 RepID=A0A6H5FXC5_9HEMI|nr:unnamed protein product [Nesidiocoris tenuis]